MYGRMGSAYVAGIIGAPPFPAMATSYANAPLTEQEVHALTAFLEHADKVSADQTADHSISPSSSMGRGLIALMLVIGIHWRGRIKQPVKRDIFARQPRSN